MFYRINLFLIPIAFLLASCSSSGGEQAGSAALDSKDSLQQQEVTEAARAVNPCDKLQLDQVRKVFGLTTETIIEQEVDEEGAYCSYSWRPDNDLADSLQVVRLYAEGEASGEDQLKEMSANTSRTAYYEKPGEQGVLFDPQFGHVMFVQDGYLYRLSLPESLPETQQDNMGRKLAEAILNN